MEHITNELSYAYGAGNISKFRDLINDNYNVNSDYLENYPLICAIVSNMPKHDNEINKQFFDEMINSNAYCGTIQSKYFSPLIISLQKDCEDIYYMKRLLEQNIDIDESSTRTSDKVPKREDPPVFYVLESGQMDKINLFLSHKPNLKLYGKDKTPLISHLATCKDDVRELIPMLIEKYGADPNQTDTNGRNGIYHLMGILDNPKIIETAIKHIKNINHTDKSGRTALFLACMNFDQYAAEILIKKNVKVNQQDINGKTAGMFVLYNFSPNSTTKTNLLNLLTRAGLDFNLCDRNKKNIAHYLAEYMPPEEYGETLTNKLLENPQLFYKKDKNGFTPMDIIKKQHPSQYSKFNSLVEKRSENYQY